MDNRTLVASNPMLVWALTLAVAVPALGLAGQAAPPSPAPVPKPVASPDPTVEETGPPPAAVEPEEALPPGTPAISLASAVATALERNFGVLNAADAVASSRLRE